MPGIYKRKPRPGQPLREGQGIGYREKADSRQQGPEEKNSRGRCYLSEGNGSMKCFIIVGMPAAGKDIARQVARTRGYPYFATGDIVRAEAARRDAQSDAESMARLSTELRGPDGLGVTRLALKAAVSSGAPVVFMEGIRSRQEIDLIGALAESVVVAFLAPRAVRRARVLSRGRFDDDAAAFDARDRREIDYGLAVPIALADEYILNTGTAEQALSALAGIVERRNAT
jgi:dephospho-CoA kinase